MTRRLTLLALASGFLIAGCMPASGSIDRIPPPSAGETYFARGTEPGWTLDISPGRIDYVGDYGETRITAVNPGARPSFNGRHYVTDRLTVDITHGECNDGMSDRRYSDTVIIIADSQTVRGCGGEILPPADLVGTHWTFVSIRGAKVDPAYPADLRFDSKRLSGSAGCNRFAGEYQIDGHMLAAGPLVMTRMACPGPAMAQEKILAAMMSKAVRLSFLADGRLLLTGSAGNTAVLQRTI